MFPGCRSVNPRRGRRTDRTSKSKTGTPPMLTNDDLPSCVPTDNFVSHSRARRRALQPRPPSCHRASGGSGQWAYYRYAAPPLFWLEVVREHSKVPLRSSRRLALDVRGPKAHEAVRAVDLDGRPAVGLACGQEGRIPLVGEDDRRWRVSLRIVQEERSGQSEQSEQSVQSVQSVQSPESAPDRPKGAQEAS